MTSAKHLILPATLAYAGVRVSSMFGITNTFVQILAGIAGAGVGLAIAHHI